MDRFARIVLGFHGCEPAFAEALIRGEVPIDEWRPSANRYDWLGHGIYFWEYAPERARSWGGKGGVVGAIIRLGICLDLTDVRYTNMLAAHHEVIVTEYQQRGAVLPKNRGKRRDLDCLVLNSLIDFNRDAGLTFQTVRGPFLEGDPVYPGSGIRRESHIQIAVRDKGLHSRHLSPQLGLSEGNHGRRMGAGKNAGRAPQVA